MSEIHAPYPIIPPVDCDSPDDLLRAFMGVERKKIVDAERRERERERNEQNQDGEET